MNNKEKGFVVPIIIGILILITIGGVIYINTILNSKPASEEIEVEYVSPEDLIKKYYTGVIDFLNQKREDNISVDKNFVTENFIISQNKHREEIEEYCSENEFCMPVNPFICAQDFPSNSTEITFNKISRSTKSDRYPKETLLT